VVDQADGIENALPLAASKTEQSRSSIAIRFTAKAANVALLLKPEAAGRIVRRETTEVRDNELVLKPGTAGTIPCDGSLPAPGHSRRADRRYGIDSFTGEDRGAFPKLSPSLNDPAAFT
jgi:hypothetical protein